MVILFVVQLEIVIRLLYNFKVIRIDYTLPSDKQGNGWLWFDTIITINGNLSVHKRTDARTSAGSETAERYVFEKKDGCHKV